MVDNHFLSADLPLPAVEGNHRFTQIVRHSFPEKLRNRLLYEEYPKYRIAKYDTEQNCLNNTVIVRSKKILQRRPLHPDLIKTEEKKSLSSSLLPDIHAAQQSYYPYGWPLSTTSVSCSNKAPASTSNKSVMSYISLPPLYAKCTSPSKEKLHICESKTTSDEPVTVKEDAESQGETEEEEDYQNHQENQSEPDVMDHLKGEVKGDDVTEKTSDCLERKPVIPSLTVLSDILNTGRAEEEERYRHILREHGSKLLVDSNSYQTFARKRARVNTTKSN